MIIFSALLLAGPALGLWCKGGIKQVGELRSYDMKTNYMCLHAEKGLGRVMWAACEGITEQQWAICNDGSLRNVLTEKCAVAEMSSPTHLTGPVYLDGCPFDANSELHPQAKWRLGQETAWTDAMGIEQVIFMLVAETTWDWGQPWGVLSYKIGPNNSDLGYSDRAELTTYGPYPNQYWYFDNRGAVKAFGRIENKVIPYNDPDLIQLLETEWHVNTRDSYTIWEVAAGDHRDPNDGHGGYRRMAWTWYESGEIVSQFNRKCLNAEGPNSDQYLVGGSCGKVSKQQWTDQMLYDDESPGGPWMTLVPMSKLGHTDVQCITPEKWCCGEKLVMEKCEWNKSQYWRWNENVDFTKPKVEWVMKQCNDMAPPSLEVTASTTYSETVSESIAVGVEMAISSGTDFYDVSLSTSLTTTLSQQWTVSHSSSEKTIANCYWWPDGSKIQRGCLWQLEMDMSYQSKYLEWKPVITTCTPTNRRPDCPPFEMCNNEKCEECVPMGSAGRATNHMEFMKAGVNGFGKGEGKNPKPKAMKLNQDIGGEKVPATLTQRYVHVGEDGPEMRERAMTAADIIDVKHQTLADVKHKEKCSTLKKDADGCKARSDCKTIMRGKVMKSCKPQKCKKLKDRVTCMMAARCEVRRSIGFREVVCGKLKRKE